MAVPQPNKFEYIGYSSDVLNRTSACFQLVAHVAYAFLPITDEGMKYQLRPTDSLRINYDHVYIQPIVYIKILLTFSLEIMFVSPSVKVIFIPEVLAAALPNTRHDSKVPSGKIVRPNGLV
ncbi:hypothetical protein OUZ56_010120 [Daphnia magna]|uniref:Uncharacterized protein n=1 Tax=Daphnia magna TaxID=35525 RepID=A0ABR0AI07_9CRUS|nr:hypothetical protein OUZ56_010120 [Daphnia magna]